MDDETLNDLVYTDCNPVAAGLVKWGHLWPGFTTYGWRFGKTKTFYLPSWYYDDENPDNPPAITLTRVRPDIFPELTDEQLSDKLVERCRELEVKLQAELKAENKRFMGLKKLAKSKWHARAVGPEERFTTTPTVAASQASTRISQLKRDKQWRADYAGEHKKYLAGTPALFPFGSYLLPKVYRAPVEQRPP